jgi:hypothetical protein
VLFTNAYVLKVIVDDNVEFIALPTQCSSYDLVGFSGMKIRSAYENIEF